MNRSNKVRLSLILYLNYFVHGIGLIILTQNMKTLSGEWGTPLAVVSFAISGMGIGKLIAYYALGSLSDRYGRKALVVFGMGLYVVFFFGITLTHDFHIAYLLTILAGMANSALDSGTYPTFLEMNGNNGAYNILIKAAMSLGEFVLPIYIGLNENLGGWYGMSFIITGAILLINLILISRTKFPQRPKTEKQISQRLFSERLTAPKIGMLIILSIYGYTSMAVMILFTQWITLYGIDFLGMNNLQAHFLLSLYSMGSIIGVLLIFSILQRGLIRDIRLIVGLNGLSVLNLLVICFSTHPLLVSITSFLFGVTAAGGVMQVGLNIFSAMFPHAKGRVTGIYFSFGSIALFTVPIITGMLSKISTAAALRFDIVLALISLVIWVIGHRLMDSIESSDLSRERRQINSIDFFILKLLQRRFKHVRAIGLKKIQQNGTIFDSAREKEILDKIEQKIRDKENSRYYQSIFKSIMTSSKNYQSEVQEKGRVQ
ncbi:MFS transporter [Sporolactobacillus terrae]|uniref:MFS transporter n=1 Tax=Sporolactobacillus terrae TaxID=269673 RepID=A0ABX5Q449_9BACL|nr:MFS transporter [Sporolactobacillus terrae]QAA21416.1 MFS transporter [Sporolactobacillus terrae]QAA24388.1 MFS transporter [Sporolactobacillus terrae]UAK16213.1 MFS transporter [Sporolactobacillus terrae]